MNYIHQLQAKVAKLQGEIDAAYEAAMHLRKYAESDKFMGTPDFGGPTYISKYDVIHRANAIISEMHSAVYMTTD
jgi:hypothetical protein